MPFTIVSAHSVQGRCINDLNLFVMFWSNFNKIMKSDLHVYNVYYDNVTGFESS